MADFVFARLQDLLATNVIVALGAGAGANLI